MRQTLSSCLFLPNTFSFPQISPFLTVISFAHPSSHFLFLSFISLFSFSFFASLSLLPVSLILNKVQEIRCMCAPSSLFPYFLICCLHLPTSVLPFFRLSNLFFESLLFRPLPPRFISPNLSFPLNHLLCLHLSSHFLFYSSFIPSISFPLCRSLHCLQEIRCICFLLFISFYFLIRILSTSVLPSFHLSYLLSHFFNFPKSLLSSSSFLYLLCLTPSFYLLFPSFPLFSLTLYLPFVSFLWSRLLCISPSSLFNRLPSFPLHLFLSWESDLLF